MQVRERERERESEGEKSKAKTDGRERCVGGGARTVLWLASPPVQEDADSEIAREGVSQSVARKVRV